MLSRLLRCFLSDRRGSMLPMFGLAVIPMLGLIGAAVDYSRANAVKAGLQAALDSTALAMAARAPSLTETELRTQAQAYFDALFTKYGTAQVPLEVSYTTSNGPQLTISGTTAVSTQFMRIPGFGIDRVNVGGSSTAAWGNTRLRVALALDNTGSMDWSGKMPALKTAAKALIDQLRAVATNDGDVMVSIVPFAKDVNVGSGNYTASWIDWEEWEDDNGHETSTSWLTCLIRKIGRSGRTKQRCSNSTTWVPDNHNTWNGCVTDRDSPYNTTGAAPTVGTPATLFPAEQYNDCPTALMPLTYNWNNLKSKIDAMTPRGNTNTTIGLQMAWHTLRQGPPFNAPAEDSRYQYNKVIIFMTDGANTQDRWDDSNYEGDAPQQRIDARMRTACDNAKAAGITIYTIHMIDGSEALLRACASSSDKYFKITSASQTVSVFTQIGTNLSRLRVAK